MLSNRTLILSAAVLIAFAGCTDSIEPAGPAQYTNPEYPSELLGYALVASDVADAFFYQDRIWVVNDGMGMIESFSIHDEYLSNPLVPVEKDTLPLGFSPGACCLDESSGILYAESSENGVTRVDLSTGASELLYQSQSLVTDICLADGALIVSFLGPDWVARKIDKETGSVLGEFEPGWPITRAVLSSLGDRLMLSNSSFEFLLNVDPVTMELIDTLHVPERIGPFLADYSGNTVVFNQYSIDPGIYLFDGVTGNQIYHGETVNPYSFAVLMPGRNVAMAARRTDNRISVLNTENMIFAPSIYCPLDPEVFFATPDGEYIVVVTSIPGRVYVYCHQ